jgi:hypothetical protein
MGFKESCERIYHYTFIANLVDLIGTLLGISVIGSWNEGNPLIKWAVGVDYVWWLVVVGKIAMLLVVYIFLRHLVIGYMKKKSKAAYILPGFLVLSGSLVMGSGFSWLWFSGWGVTMILLLVVTVMFLLLHPRARMKVES